MRGSCNRETNGVIPGQHISVGENAKIICKRALKTIAPIAFQNWTDS